MPKIPQLGGVKTHRLRAGRLWELIWIAPIAERLASIQSQWFRNRGIRAPANDALKFARSLLVKSSEPLSAWEDEHYFVGLEDGHVHDAGCSCGKCGGGSVALKAEDDPFGFLGDFPSDLPDWVTDPVLRNAAVNDLLELIAKYLPNEVIDQELSQAAVMSWWAGRVREQLQKRSVQELKKIRPELPDSYQAILEKHPEITEPELRRIDAIRRRGLIGLTGATQNLKSRIRDVLEDAAARNIPVAKMRQELFYEFGAMNRDWRMIAVTEANGAASDGYLSGLPLGSIVRSLEAANACEWCLAYSRGREFIVVPDSHPDKDPDKYIWPAKSNIGKKQNAWTVSWGPIHPHCRKVWSKVGKSPEFSMT